MAGILALINIGIVDFTLKQQLCRMYNASLEQGSKLNIAGRSYTFINDMNQ